MEFKIISPHTLQHTEISVTRNTTKTHVLVEKWLRNGMEQKNVVFVSRATKLFLEKLIVYYLVNIEKARAI
jgi:hypothetical protein